MTVFNHPPDFGSELKKPGKAANKPKGKAKPIPKPAIPEVSCQAPPSEDKAPTSKVPNIGPVQEKETKAKVRAIKNTPIIPPTPSAALTYALMKERKWDGALSSERGVAGIRNRKAVKCLHAHLAHYLSGESGHEHNVIGKWVYERVDELIRERQASEKEQTEGKEETQA